MKVYITKYALTQGIIEREIIKNKDYPDMVVDETTNWRTPYHKPYWHETMEDAIKHAGEMRLKKIASLKKSITKLEKLKFE